MADYMIAVDQSTSASKVFLVDRHGKIVQRFSKPHQQYYPKPGYAEHDMAEVWQNVLEGIRLMVSLAAPGQIAAVAISNQRETTVLWDRFTGEPVARAIVWQDVRAQELCDRLQEYAAVVGQRTGLALSPYYPAAKAAHFLRSNLALYERVVQGDVCIGTVDSYLVYRMTEGRNFCTDVSNASRTALFNLHTLEWDEELCDLFGIPSACLPQVLPSDGNFGVMEENGIPITGVMGDSHAALFGQGCLTAGMTKATFGTGSSVMMNVGTQPVQSVHGLSSSVGFGFRGQTHYVLEGNVTCSGDTLCWLRDEAQMIDSIDEIEKLAGSVADTQGVYLVPAFSGLSAPYFDSQARAAILGMSRSTTRAHIVRAALESMAYQNADILLAMARDTGAQLRELRVDGSPVKNALLMQRLSDLTGCRIQCTQQSELSALGAACMAGITKGLYTKDQMVNITGASYLPEMSADERTKQMTAWQDAVQRCR